MSAARQALARLSIGVALNDDRVDLLLAQNIPVPLQTATPAKPTTMEETQVRPSLEAEFLARATVPVVSQEMPRNRSHMAWPDAYRQNFRSTNQHGHHSEHTILKSCEAPGVRHSSAAALFFLYLYGLGDAGLWVRTSRAMHRSAARWPAQ